MGDKHVANIKYNPRFDLSRVGAMIDITVLLAPAIIADHCNDISSSYIASVNSA